MCFGRTIFFFCLFSCVSAKQYLSFAYILVFWSNNMFLLPISMCFGGALDRRMDFGANANKGICCKGENIKRPQLSWHIYSKIFLDENIPQIFLRIKLLQFPTPVSILKFQHDVNIIASYAPVFMAQIKCDKIFQHTKNIEIFIFKQYRANFSMRAHFNWILIPPRRGGSLNWKHAVLPETKTFYHLLYEDDNFSTEIEIVTFFMVWLKATLGFSKC